MKKIIFIGILIAGFLFLGGITFAQNSYLERISASLSVNPSSFNVSPGAPLKISVQLDPNKHKICAIGGYLSFASELFGNPYIEKIEVVKGIKAEPLPTAVSPRFYLVLPNCLTAKQNVMEITIKGDRPGSATIKLDGVIMYGLGGAVVSSVTKGGQYNVVALTNINKNNFAAALTLNSENFPTGLIVIICMLALWYILFIEHKKQPKNKE